MDSITVRDLFYLNREYRFFLLVLLDYLSYDLKFSLLIIAFFLWLQDRNNDQSIISKLLHVPNCVDTTLVIKEASNYINFLLASDSIQNPYNHASISSNQLGLIIPIHSLYQSKYAAISGMKRYLRTTCTRFFSDILSSRLRFDRSLKFFPYEIINIPGSPDEVFGPIYFKLWPENHLFVTSYEISSWIQAKGYIEDEDDQSLYVTFSRGSSVSREEVKEVFTSKFGDCVQFLDMANNVKRKKKVLFARVVMKRVEIVDCVLKGEIIAKFKTIKGKNVWVKKYRTKMRYFI